MTRPAEFAAPDPHPALEKVPGYRLGPRDEVLAVAGGAPEPSVGVLKQKMAAP